MARQVGEASLPELSRFATYAIEQVVAGLPLSRSAFRRVVAFEAKTSGRRIFSANDEQRRSRRRGTGVHLSVALFSE